MAIFWWPRNGAVFAQYPVSIIKPNAGAMDTIQDIDLGAAAVTGPKDFVMVLDVSGSMKTAAKTTGEDGEENEETKIIDHENRCKSPARHDHVFRFCGKLSSTVVAQII